MKNLFVILVTLIFVPAQAQLTTTTVCPAIVVEILDGRVNGIEPDFNASLIKQTLPCFTSVEPDSSRCGGGIFYKDKDIYFYTGRDYIEIKEKFKGRMSIPLMGASRSSLFKWLGNPKIKDVNWDAFQTQYGTLVLYYNKLSKINRIIFSKRSTETLSICE